MTVAQGQGSWGGASGWAGLAVGVIFVGLAIVAVLTYALVGAFGARRPLRLAIALAAACAPIAFCGQQSAGFNAGLEDLQAEERRLREGAEKYLATHCPQLVKKTATAPLTGQAGIVLRRNGQTPPDIDGIPPDTPPTASVRLQQKKYGYSYPPLSNTPQYKSVLHWTDYGAYAHDLVAAGFAFVEYDDSTGKTLRRASLAWWRANTAPDVLDKLLVPYHGGATVDPGHTLEFPAMEYRAGYQVELRDVSTLQDRSHWVARGRIRLTARADGALLGEYTGLSAAHAILSPGYGMWWEKVSVCPGAETRYLTEGRWKSLPFFFGEIVKVRG